jgi:hypothetical protein
LLHYCQLQHRHVPLRLLLLLLLLMERYLLLLSVF